MRTKLAIRLEQQCIGGRKILGRCHLDIAEGELAVLLGESGCGKSTLLKILVGLQQEFMGTISIADSGIAAGSKCGIVFQDARLLPWLTVLDNVIFALPATIARSQRKQRAIEALALVGLVEARQKLPRQLSGGMAQKAALARALVNLPQVLLLDEPFRALDLHTRLNLQEELLEILAQTHTTALLVTHDVDEAIALADKVAVMSSAPGEIVCVRQINTQKRCRTADELSILRRDLIDELFTAQMEGSKFPKSLQPSKNCSLSAQM